MSKYWKIFLVMYFISGIAGLLWYIIGPDFLPDIVFFISLSFLILLPLLSLIASIMIWILSNKIKTKKTYRIIVKFISIFNLITIFSILLLVVILLLNLVLGLTLLISGLPEKITDIFDAIFYVGWVILYFPTGFLLGRGLKLLEK